MPGIGSGRCGARGEEGKRFVEEVLKMVSLLQDVCREGLQRGEFMPKGRRQKSVNCGRVVL